MGGGERGRLRKMHCRGERAGEMNHRLSCAAGANMAVPYIE